MRISITLGPSPSDPSDAAPITIIPDQGSLVQVAAITWRSRLAIFLLRSYVKKLIK